MPLYTPSAVSALRVARKTSDQSVSTTTPTAMTDILLSAEANARYYFRLCLFFTSVGGDGRIRTSFSLPSGATVISGQLYIPSGGGSAVSISSLTTGSLPSSYSGSGSNSYLTAEGVIAISTTAGDIGLTFYRDATGTGTDITAKADTTLQLLKT